MEASEDPGQALHSPGRGADGVTDHLDLEGRVVQNPYGTVALALGAGYLLGGGLFSPLTARVLGFGLRLGLRAVVLPILADHLLAIAQDSMGVPVATPDPAPVATPGRNGGGGVTPRAHGANEAL